MTSTPWDVTMRKTACLFVSSVSESHAAPRCPLETSEQIGGGPGCSARSVAKLSCLGGVETSSLYSDFERALARHLVSEALLRDIDDRRRPRLTGV
jgi:hypothetical protein